MSNRRWLIGGALGVVALVAAAFGVWWFVLRSDAPPPVDLATAAAGVTSTTGTAAAPATTVPDRAADDDLSGTWSVADDGDSFVGYRVKEELAQIGFTEAVGRTSAIDATMTLDGARITAVAVEADMTALRSDSDRRDRALQGQALETADFPSASFVLTQPIDLDSVPAAGEEITATAVGDLTIHGVTNAVRVPIQAQLVDDTIVVVGSIPVVFADYGMDSPSSFAVLSVEDNGIVELQLLFTRG